MDLSPTAEQHLLATSARGFLARACLPAHVRAMENDPRGVDLELWRRMAALGWTGMLLPGGQTILDAAFVLEEMGRVVLPSPFLACSVVAAPLLARLVDAGERRRWLAGVAAGETIVTLALAEPGWRDEWGRVGLEAERDGGGVRLSGRKLFVPFATVADLLLVAVRLDGCTALVLVDAGGPGVERVRLATVGGDPVHEVVFTGARARAVIPDAASALERALLDATVGSLAYALGAAERVLEMTVDYAKTRVQFGRPIGAFQAVAHRCADMRSDVDALRVLVHQAAWCLATGRRAELEIGAAKAWGNEALRRIQLHAHQVHGAIGFSTECDLQLFTRRLKAAELQWGSAAAHRERVARAMGL